MLKVVGGQTITEHIENIMLEEEIQPVVNLFLDGSYHVQTPSLPIESVKAVIYCDRAGVERANNAYTNASRVELNTSIMKVRGHIRERLSWEDAGYEYFRAEVLILVDEVLP